LIRLFYCFEMDVLDSDSFGEEKRLCNEVGVCITLKLLHSLGDLNDGQVPSLALIGNVLDCLDCGTPVICGRVSRGSEYPYVRPFQCESTQEPNITALGIRHTVEKLINEGFDSPLQVGLADDGYV